MRKSLVLKSILAVLISIVSFQSCNTSKTPTEETVNIGPAKNQTNTEMSNIYSSFIPSATPSVIVTSTVVATKTPSIAINEELKTYKLTLSVKTGKASLYLTYTDPNNGSFLFNFETINDTPSKIQLLDQYNNIIVSSKAIITGITGNITDVFSKQEGQKISKIQLFFDNSNMVEDIISDNLVTIDTKATPIYPIPLPTPKPTPTNTPSPSDSWSVSTFVGNITSGFSDGTGNSAKFYELRSLATDSSGNIFVTDSYNNRIRKITPEKVVTTFAGNTIAGSTDGIGEEAQFNNPIGVGIDSYNNIYIADSNNYKIRKITPLGVVTTLAGGTFGDVDGLGSEAKFGLPTGLALDSYGNVYVSDFHNNKIKKILPSGLVTTIAGSGAYGSKNGNALISEFANPYGLAVDKYGNLYVADSSNNSIRKIDNTGNVTTIAGSVEGYMDGTLTSAKFSYPTGITIDSNGVMFVTDSNNSRIRKVLYNGTVTTIAGTGELGNTDGIGSIARFLTPTGVLVNKTGELFITDTNKIRKITSIK